jgi:ankyrin repeat protein
MTILYTLGLLSACFLSSTHAITYTDFESLKQSIETGSHSVKETNFLDETLLHEACQKGDIQSVSYLIDNNAYINACDDLGETPLHVASCMGHVDIVTMLINRGADIHRLCNIKNTPLHYAADQGHIHICHILITSGVDINQQNFYQKTALHHASEKGFTDIVRALIKAGADTHKHDNTRAAPIHYACMKGHFSTVSALIHAGANINHQQNTQNTPLHDAAYHGHYNIVRILIESGAHINIKDKNGNTPLHYAFLCGYTEIARILLSHGASVDITNSENQTPIAITNKKLQAHNDLCIRRFCRNHLSSPDIIICNNQSKEPEKTCAQWHRQSLDIATLAFIQSGNTSCIHRRDNFLRLLSDKCHNVKSIEHICNPQNISYHELSKRLHTYEQALYFYRLCAQGLYKTLFRLIKEKHHIKGYDLSRTFFDDVIRMLGSDALKSHIQKPSPYQLYYFGDVFYTEPSHTFLTFQQIKACISELHSIASESQTYAHKNIQNFTESCISHLDWIHDRYLAMSLIRVLNINNNTSAYHGRSLLTHAIWLDQHDFVRMLLQSDHINIDGIHAFYDQCKSLKYSCADLKKQHNHPETKKYAQWIYGMKHLQDTLSRVYTTQTYNMALTPHKPMQTYKLTKIDKKRHTTESMRKKYMINRIRKQYRYNITHYVPQDIARHITSYIDVCEHNHNT